MTILRPTPLVSPSGRHPLAAAFLWWTFVLRSRCHYRLGDAHHAAALDQRGALLGSRSFTVSASGYRELLAWLRTFGEVERIGVESTGSYAAGLTRYLLGEGAETYPSAGGDATGGGGGSPAKALGARNAHRLEALGPEGRAATSALAATTTPPPALAPRSRKSGRQAPGSGGQRGSGAADRASGEGHGDQAGSSGLGQVIAQATGSSSSGQMGLLLPLVIALSLIGSISFALSRRRESPRGGQ